MSQRRMFSPQIVESEEFISMPVSSQALYFHLGMNADDDGFAQPKLIMRTIGFNEDDLKVLLAKRFLLPFESGVVVIKHWLIHNMIRADRYKKTRFQTEKETLYIKENKAYTDHEPALATIRQPNGNHLAPQVRLGKVSIVSELKNSQSEEEIDDVTFEDDVSLIPTRDIGKKKRPPKKQSEVVFVLFRKNYPRNWLVNKTQRASADNLVTERGLDGIKSALNFYREYKDTEFCPDILSPYDLDSKWDKLIAFKKKIV